ICKKKCKKRLLSVLSRL
uniref:Uncharacterized protein n=1 Tax=Acrobeloides nanus TaxID=290746 RepID=A0A914DQ12_9BILA